MADILDALAAITASPLHARIMSSIDAVIRSIDLYGEEGLALSLNGGKDSTVLLHLIRAGVYLRGRHQSGNNVQSEAEASCRPLGGITSFFFDTPDDFPEVVSFTKKTADEYDLSLRVYTSSFFEGLEELLSSTSVKAIFLGTRRGDPNADDQVFSPSSKGWPGFMRVNPIMCWSYHDVWEFLLLCKVGYCGLYDVGYTSLGSVGRTFPNGALLRDDGKYSPAHMLTDPKLERSGRGNASAREAGENNGTESRQYIPTAGLCIIGDEILSGKVEELNCKFLLKQLRGIGWKTVRVSYVGDQEEDIARAVVDLSETCDAVLTCGGLGPTLDDVTMKAVAQAIGRKVSASPALEDAIRKHFGEHLTVDHLKMAAVPDGPETVLIEHRGEDGRPSAYPLVRCRNIYILPGVPSVVEKKWGAIREDLSRLMTPSLASVSSAGRDIDRMGGSTHSAETTPGTVMSLDEDQSPPLERRTTREIPFSTHEVRVRCEDGVGEASVVKAMEDIDRRFGRTVSIASYPEEDGDTVLLQLESKDQEALALAQDGLRDLLKGLEATTGLRILDGEERRG